MTSYLDEWNVQQKALRDKERQNKNAAAAGLNMYHGGEHDIKEHDKAPLKDFRLQQRQRQESARKFLGAHQDSSNTVSREQGATRSDEGSKWNAREKETRLRELVGGTRWTGPEKEFIAEEEAGMDEAARREFKKREQDATAADANEVEKSTGEEKKVSSIERRIARRKAAEEEVKRKAAEEQAQQTKAEKQSAAPAIVEEDKFIPAGRVRRIATEFSIGLFLALVWVYLLLAHIMFLR
jgi:hypothetical protein